MQRNLEKCREIQRNAEKFRETQRNAEKLREIQRKSGSGNPLQCFVWNVQCSTHCWNNSLKNSKWTGVVWCWLWKLSQKVPMMNFTMCCPLKDIIIFFTILDWQPPCVELWTRPLYSGVQLWKGPLTPGWGGAQIERTGRALALDLFLCLTTSLKQPLNK